MNDNDKLNTVILNGRNSILCIGKDIKQRNFFYFKPSIN